MDGKDYQYVVPTQQAEPITVNLFQDQQDLLGYLPVLLSQWTQILHGAYDLVSCTCDNAGLAVLFPVEEQQRR